VERFGLVAAAALGLLQQAQRLRQYSFPFFFPDPEVPILFFILNKKHFYFL
jgi:hypothetical protein